MLFSLVALKSAMGTSMPIRHTPRLGHLEATTTVRTGKHDEPQPGAECNKADESDDQGHKKAGPCQRTDHGGN